MLPDTGRLLLGVSGSASVLALPAYVAALRQAGAAQIVAVMTGSAARLLPASSLALLCDKVYTDDTGAGQHVTLSRWADTFLVLPATAHSLGCAASGLSPNLLTTTILAASRGVVFVPAMNATMWRNPAVQRNVHALRGDGHSIIDPVAGTAWEVASRSFVETYIMPPPESLMGALTARAASSDTPAATGKHNFSVAPADD